MFRKKQQPTPADIALPDNWPNRLTIKAAAAAIPTDTADLADLLQWLAGHERCTINLTRGEPGPRGGRGHTSRTPDGLTIAVPPHAGGVMLTNAILHQVAHILIGTSSQPCRYATLGQLTGDQRTAEEDAELTATVITAHHFMRGKPPTPPLTFTPQD